MTSYRGESDRPSMKEPLETDFPGLCGDAKLFKKGNTDEPRSSFQNLTKVKQRIFVSFYSCMENLRSLLNAKLQDVVYS